MTDLEFLRNRLTVLADEAWDRGRDGARARGVPLRAAAGAVSISRFEDGVVAGLTAALEEVEKRLG